MTLIFSEMEKCFFFFFCKCKGLNKTGCNLANCTSVTVHNAAVSLGFRGLCQSARTPVAKHHRFGEKQQIFVFLTVLEAGKLRSRCP